MKVGARALAWAVLWVLASAAPSWAADKAFQREDLADSVIRLEAQIKQDAGPISAPIATLRKQIAAAAKKKDLRTMLQIQGQVISLAPQEAANWQELAETILQLRVDDQREQRLLLERASSAAYAAYQRAETGETEGRALATLGDALSQRKLWRPALDALRISLSLNENAPLREQYEALRSEHGFRLLDYSVDSDSASPRACFQFSEDLRKRADFSPFVTLAGTDKPALSSDGAQLCVGGLKHGERYQIALRAGLPSAVAETLPRPADFTLYVRDRKPFVHFTGRAYVLPRIGQQGIPLVSVNTQAVEIQVLRISDRNLIDTVTGYQFQRNLSAYEIETMGEERGIKVWSGEMSISPKLNEDVTTAFPVLENLGTLQPGVYAMTAKPKGPQGDDDYGALATQWFIVSDLGLTAFSGNDGIHVFVNSLASAEPVAGSEIRLVSRSNEVLATRTTDSGGHVLFEAGLARGAGGLSPALLTAKGAGTGPKADYAFLSLKTPAFDLTDRGVAGRAVPAGLDAFVYAERGVYRSGESVHLTGLVRDGQGKAALGAPLTFVLERPDGVEYQRAVVPDQGAGGHSLSIALNNAVPTGTWRVRAFTDPKAPAIGETTFMVEDYVPDRIEFEVTSDNPAIAPDAPAILKVDGRFLYGAPAAGLSLEGEVAVRLADERPGFAGYRFGVSNEDEPETSERQELSELPDTDAKGHAGFPVALDKVPATQRPLEARITIRMAESGGRAVERNLTKPVAPSEAMIGVKPLFSGDSIAEGEAAKFGVVFVSPQGEKQNRKGLRYELLKLESRYQWYRQGSSWEYEPVKSSTRVADGTVDAIADGPANIEMHPAPGRYRLDVRGEGADGPLTSLTFDVGWYAEASADSPDLLETSIDKAAYASGETMVVNVNARTAGRLTVNVVGDRLLATREVEVEAGAQKVSLDVGDDWGSGAYVVATLRRPLDAQAKRMPGRAIGIKWFSIDRAARTLKLTLSPPDLVRPGLPMSLPIKVEGLSPGEDAKIVVAAVDVGILNLTNYQPPAPNEYYLGQRQLTTEIRDLYGQLIDGMQGTRGAVRTGGDIAAQELQGSPPSQKPLALYSGIVTLGADGTANVTFDIPDFAGTARVMAVAWSASKVGQAVKDVTIRDPLVLTTTLPRFLLNGDRGTLHLDFNNVEGPAGDYTISFGAEGPVKLDGVAKWALKLDEKQRGILSMGVMAEGAGSAQVDIKVEGPNGLALSRAYTLNVRPATQILARRTVKTLQPGESLTLSKDLFTEIVAGTGAASVSVSRSASLDAASILTALDRYPYGCSEQITSRALPLLYVNELAAENQLALDASIDARIKAAIDKLLARQGSNGSFGLWSAGGDDAWLDAYVTDFLTRARERGFKVPDIAFQQATDHLKNFAVNAEEPEKNGGRDLAYALYVLARNGLAPVGDLRYLADTKLDALATPIAKAQLAAALALVGDRVRAERAYQAALDALAPRPQLVFGRTDYGSALRDAAALISLGSEGKAPQATIVKAVERVEVARELTPQTSTQENAWLLLAARALAKDKDNLKIAIGGDTQTRPVFRAYRPDDLTNPIKISNEGGEPAQAVLSVSGAPTSPEPAAEQGFKIERQYFTLDGQGVDPSRTVQNQRLAVVLKITETRPVFGRVMVADYLPAGFEIDNPNLVSSGETGTLDWIENAQEPVNTEFRDDRFTAAFNRGASDPAVFTVAYIVRAVSPGSYVLPQAFVEDMYNPSRFGRTGTGAIEVIKAQ